MISREGNAVISKEPVFFYMCFFVTCIDTSQILILSVQAVFEEMCAVKQMLKAYLGWYLGEVR